MTDAHHHADCPPMIAVDVAIEEKVQVARMAAATLHKLHDAMHRMKEWRDDSVKLKSSIWRMKMVLQADDRLDNQDQRVDPLIAYQRAQISRLEQANDDLANQVTSLKRALSKAEGDAVPVREMGDQIARMEMKFAQERERLNDEILSLRTRLSETEEEQSVTLQHHLKDKLLELARGDRTVEVVLANAIGRVVETVVGLSEELVYVSEDLCRFKTKNRNLHVKLDRLRAMLRTRCGGGAEYRKRIGELSNLATQLLGEMDRLRGIRENDANHGDVPDVVARVERLMSDLRSNLRNEREALIAAGDPDCLRYMRKVIDLRVNLRVLSVELKRERSRENVRFSECGRAVSQLNDFLQRIDMEIESCRVKPMHRYCRIGGVSGTRYAAKVAELEAIVKRSIGVIAALKQEDSSEIMSTSGGDKATAKTTKEEELADSIERLCRKMKDLEVLDDRASLRGRIDRLEASVTRLELQLAARDERVRALRSSLTRDHERHEKIVAAIRAENESLRGDINNRKGKISELSREREHSARRAAAEMQLMKAEIDAAAKKLRDLHDDREALLREMEGMRNILRGKDSEIEDITAKRDALGNQLEAEVGRLRTQLEIASDENAKLKTIIEAAEAESGSRAGERSDKMKSSTEDEGVIHERDNGEGTRRRARAANPRDELERLKAESNESEISLNEANQRIDHLTRALDKAVGDRARMKGEIRDLKSNEQSLTHRLNVRTSACEAATGESERATAENKVLAGQVKQLRNENEQLAVELSALRSEKGLLARAMADANNERATLQARLGEFTSAHSGLQERLSEHESLKLQLKGVRAELANAGVQVTHLRAENVRIAGVLEAESRRSCSAEERARVLLTEKNELATRINEVDGASVALRERLNKAEAGNEYFSIELNKSRLESDRARTKNALLQVTCDKRERDNGALRRERDDARARLNEIASEYRMLGNQLGIQRMKYEEVLLRFAAAASTLYHHHHYHHHHHHRENNDLAIKTRLKKIDTRYPLARARERGFAAARHTATNDVKHKRDYSDAARAEAIKLGSELSELLDDAEFKVESDARAGHDNKAKIKDKRKSARLKSLTTNKGYKALKLELADLRRPEDRGQGQVQPARTKGELESRSLAWTLEGPSNVEEIVDSVVGRREIVNIYCKTAGSSDYPNYSNDPVILGDDEERWSTVVVAIDRLEVENAALKMELDILRGGLNCSLIDGEKTKTELAGAADEIQALKLELMNLRDERAALRSRLEMFKEELNALGSERVALKDELAASRKSNLELGQRANDLRAAHERLKKTNAGLEGLILQDASRRINEDPSETHGIKI